MIDSYRALASAIYVCRQFMANGKIETDDQKLRASGLYADWVPGNHKAGEIYNAVEQTWECYADYDNAVYPDVAPGNAAWFTFNRPLHGRTKETARPWVQPTHAEDIYKTGEWMFWTDGAFYECIAIPGTDFSPAEYPGGWRNGGIA